MTELSGKFDYNGLKNILREKGILNKDLNKAIRQVESDNNIDSIKDADEKQKMVISDSIWNFTNPASLSTKPEYLDEENPFGNVWAKMQTAGTNSAQDSTFSGYNGALNNEFTFNLADNKIIGDGTNLMDMPEPLYDIDEYEAVDYEEFYNFGDETEETEKTEEKDESKDKADEEEKLDLNTFETKYGGQFASSGVTDTQKQEAMKNIFNKLDANSSGYLEQSELAGAFYSSALSKDKKDTTIESAPLEGDNLLGGEMMEMDMSNDSFSAQ